MRLERQAKPNCGYDKRLCLSFSFLLFKAFEIERLTIFFREMNRDHPCLPLFVVEGRLLNHPEKPVNLNRQRYRTLPRRRVNGGYGRTLIGC